VTYRLLGNDSITLSLLLLLLLRGARNDLFLAGEESGDAFEHGCGLIKLCPSVEYVRTERGWVGSAKGMETCRSGEKTSYMQLLGNFSAPKIRLRPLQLPALVPTRNADPPHVPDDRGTSKLESLTSSARVSAG
jgi:hypothetical protein